MDETHGRDYWVLIEYTAPSARFLPGLIGPGDCYHGDETMENYGRFNPAATPSHEPITSSLKWGFQNEWGLQSFLKAESGK